MASLGFLDSFSTRAKLHCAGFLSISGRIFAGGLQILGCTSMHVDEGMGSIWRFVWRFVGPMVDTAELRDMIATKDCCITSPIQFPTYKNDHPRVGAPRPPWVGRGFAPPTPHVCKLFWPRFHEKCFPACMRCDYFDFGLVSTALPSRAFRLHRVPKCPKYGACPNVSKTCLKVFNRVHTMFKMCQKTYQTKLLQHSATFQSGQ